MGERISIPKDMFEVVKGEAAREGKTPQDMVCEILEKYVKEAELVEVTLKIPKKVLVALKEYVLDEGETVEEYLEREIPEWVTADVDCIANDDPNVDDPIALIEKMGLKEYYDR